MVGRFLLTLFVCLVWGRVTSLDSLCLFLYGSIPIFSFYRKRDYFPILFLSFLTFKNNNFSEGCSEKISGGKKNTSSYLLSIQLFEH